MHKKLWREGAGWQDVQPGEHWIYVNAQGETLFDVRWTELDVPQVHVWHTDPAIEERLLGLYDQGWCIVRHGRLEDIPGAM